MPKSSSTRAHLRDDLVHLRPVGGVERQHAGAMLGSPTVQCRVGRVVAELVVLDQHPHHVDAEPVDAAAQPEAQHVEHRRPHRRIAPVEVGLLSAGRSGSSTGRSPSSKVQAGPPKLLSQLLGGPPSGAGIAPEIPVALRRSSATSGCRGTRDAGRRCGSARSRGSA